MEARHNPYPCPVGQTLSARTGVIVHFFGSGVAKADSILYRSSARDCGLKMQCYPNTPIRKIARRIPEQARDVVRRLSTTTGYLQSRCERKKVEMLFVHLKRILRLDRLRLRSMNGARDAILMAARVQNLKKNGKVMGTRHQKGIKGSHIIGKALAAGIFIEMMPQRLVLQRHFVGIPQVMVHPILRCQKPGRLRRRFLPVV